MKQLLIGVVLVSVVGMVGMAQAAAIDLTWTAPAVTPTNDAATGYSVRKGTTSTVCSSTTPLSTVLATVGNVTAYSDLNVPSGSVACYEVRATNAGGMSGPSNRVTLTVPVNPPGAPTLNAVIR